MGDRPIPELNNKTPMEVANKPNMDRLAAVAELGLCDTVNGLKPGSDIANMAVMGYDPRVYHTGRSPLEAMSIGVPMGENDITFRCNLVTLSEEEEYEARTMIDYSAGEISTAEARELILALQEALGTPDYCFYPGISYRHCLLMHTHADSYTTTPPHDISLKPIKEYLPDNEVILDLMKRSAEILRDHPVNIARRNAGKRPANSAWFWGDGTKPRLDSFASKFGVSAAMITAVDLLRGIGICADMQVLDVEGVTGNVDTNFVGKGEAAIEAFKNGTELVYVHVEAPDECGHRGEIENKIFSIEQIDRHILGPVLDYLENCGEPYRIMILPDHFTPIEIRTHSSEPVPYLIFDSNSAQTGKQVCFCENTAREAGNFEPVGYHIMDRLIVK